MYTLLFLSYTVFKQFKIYYEFHPTLLSKKYLLEYRRDKKIKFSKNMYLGDIIISYNYLNKPKSQDLELFKQKTIKIFIHGFLHLLGFDHIKNKDYHFQEASSTLQTAERQ